MNQTRRCRWSDRRDDWCRIRTPTTVLLNTDGPTERSVVGVRTQHSITPSDKWLADDVCVLFLKWSLHSLWANMRRFKFHMYSMCFWHVSTFQFKPLPISTQLELTKSTLNVLCRRRPLALTDNNNVVLCYSIKLHCQFTCWLVLSSTCTCMWETRWSSRRLWITVFLLN